MFKEYADKKDPLYVYKINDKRGKPDMPSFVLKTSTTKMTMALHMDKTGDHFLSKEFFFFNGKRKQCKGFVTLTASVYHPLLWKQIPLAIMEAESENTENVVFGIYLMKPLGKWMLLIALNSTLFVGVAIWQEVI